MQSRLFAMFVMAFYPLASLFSQSEFLDPAFGQNGRQLLHFLPSDDQGFAVQQRPDGRILVAGRAVIDSFNQFVVTQYLPDGRLDPEFDIDGKRSINFGTGQEIAYAATLMPDGRSLVAGFAGPGGFEDFAVARLMPDGQPDNSFAGAGHATYDFNFGSDYAYAVLYQPDGKIVPPCSPRASTSTRCASTQRRRISPSQPTRRRRSTRCGRTTSASSTATRCP